MLSSASSQQNVWNDFVMMNILIFLESNLRNSFHFFISVLLFTLSWIGISFRANSHNIVCTCTTHNMQCMSSDEETRSIHTIFLINIDGWRKLYATFADDYFSFSCRNVVHLKLLETKNKLLIISCTIFCAQQNIYRWTAFFCFFHF